MRAHLEKLVHAGKPVTSFSTSERTAPTFPFYWHYHPEYELTLIVRGSGQRLVGDGIADYKPGDLVLLGPNLPHSWRSAPFQTAPGRQNRAVVVHFRDRFLGEPFFALPEMRKVARLLKRSGHGLAFSNARDSKAEGRRLRLLPRIAPAQRLVTLLWILMDLADIVGAERLSSGRFVPICRVEEQCRIDKICGYVEANFDKEIDFRGLAHGIGMHQSSMCRYFKRATGRTLTKYLNELRIAAASELLLSTDLNVLEVALRVGFDNYAYFCRLFKRMKGCTPRFLRNEFCRT